MMVRNNLLYEILIISIEIFIFFGEFVKFHDRGKESRIFKKSAVKKVVKMKLSLT